MIKYDKASHTYKNEEGADYISVTTLLARLFPFNAAEIAAKVNNMRGSCYYGMGVERITEQWQRSSGLGHMVHNAVENYIKEGSVPDDKSLVPLVDQFKRLNFKGTLMSEVMVQSSDEYKIAGTVDIIEDTGKHLYVWDIKTYKKITDDKVKKCSYQLEIYKRLIENTLGRPTIVGGIIIFENFAVDRKNTRLKVVKAIPCVNEVDDIFKNRKKELRYAV